MSDTTKTAGSGGPRRRWLTGNNTSVIVAACVISILCILIGGHLYGRFLSARDLGGRDNAIQQLVAQNQKLKRQLDEKSAQATEVQAKLDRVQATLSAIMPSADTYNVTPNQSLVVANGRLSVGLVGSPANEGVTLNINGKNETVAAGQSISVTPDASTSCRIEVQSFDMFKAVIVATCTGTKPK
ncbi:MAG: prefoldin domain-containing protein [Xanthobacteraceae bacterium]